MKFDPQQLRVFATLLGERSVSRASLELHTSRSNVRRIWQVLENQLGETLFEKSDHSEVVPTQAALRLECEMSSLLDEIRAFESTVTRIHKNGRVLRLGADRNIFNTKHFGRIFNSLRHDPRFRVSFVELKPCEGRPAIEAGFCDLLFSVDGIPGRRLETRELPPIPLDVACARAGDATGPMPPSSLKARNWSLAAFAGHSQSHQTLRRIQDSGAGTGRLCSQIEFLNWAEDPRANGTEAVICVRPASFVQQSRVSFFPFDSQAGFPLHISYLKQHPYDFLETTVDQMHRTLSAPPDGIRSPQS